MTRFISLFALLVLTFAQPAFAQTKTDADTDGARQHSKPGQINPG